MTKSKIILCAAIGTAAALVLVGCKNATVRNYVSDEAKKWKKKLKRLANTTGNELSDLKDLIGNKVQGLSDETRKALLDVLNEGSQAAGRIQNKAKGAM